MIRGLIFVAIFMASPGIVVAQQDDPIATRKATMKAVGEGFYGDMGKMNKGQAPFDPNKADAALSRIVDAAKKMPTLFPDSAKSGGETHALPKIWDDKADFNARWEKLGEAASAALIAVKDEASLKAQFAAVGDNCTNCHERYRAKLD